MDFILIYKALKRKWWLLVTVPILAATIAYFVASSAEKVYKSTTQLSTGITTDEGVTFNEDGNFNPFEIESKFTNLIENIKSETIINMVSLKLLLHDLDQPDAFRYIENYDDGRPIYSKEDFKTAKEIAKNKYDSLKGISTFNSDERMVAKLLKDLGYDYKSLMEEMEIRRVSNSDYISINYISEDPYLSAFVVNTLAQEFIRYQNKNVVSQSGQSIQFFEELSKQKKEQLDEKISELESFKAANNVIDTEVQSESNVSKISDLESQRSEVRREIYSLNLQLENINQKIRNHGGEGNQSGSYGRILQLRNLINEVNKEYIRTGDEVLLDSLQNLRAERDRLQSQASTGTTIGGEKVSLAELRDTKDDIELQLRVARETLLDINSDIASLQYNVKDYASVEGRLGALQQEVDLAQQEYLAAQEKLNDARNKSKISESSIKQSMIGQPATDPESTKTIIITGFAGLLSFILCVFGIVFVEYLDFSIKTPTQFIRQTGLPFAGAINHIKENDKLNLQDLFGSDSDNEELNIFKQELRKIRFEIEQLKPKSILFTSTRQGSGKTFSLLCLAYSLSLINKRILIVDTNFKHNSLTDILIVSPYNNQIEQKSRVRRSLKLLDGGAGKASFTEEPENGEEYNEDNESIIRTTSHKLIDVIGCKTGTDSPSEIFSGRNFDKMLEEFKHQYDYVLLEGAALNDFPDSKELISYVDAVIPVFSADTVLKVIDKESIKYLKTLKGKLIGSILNKVTTENLKI
ncbi:Wzz/FepE/Etk N-terminal domain-containing protein [Mangrovivirga sp. M17]|uniref:Wzz/FepE/Etk N-terminal domain-containing protein n=1 Tax=Mangrovivirga halotolerans TaxID=2993936 RepID=A0ABT3RWY9_9BACT|nr:Wzz/FepE/Etk N-terminal domain-containing protein [Mangrovivirga halotolerans]MCX2745873.1 Wzz/FepE/Etk N-terminal domain-containing protein [Mangrovivirga halotolerans]